MKQYKSYRLAALVMALALCLPAAARAEALGEVALDDPVIHTQGAVEAPEVPEDGADWAWTEAAEIVPERVDAPVVSSLMGLPFSWMPAALRVSCMIRYWLTPCRYVVRLTVRRMISGRKIRMVIMFRRHSADRRMRSISKNSCFLFFGRSFFV